VLVTSAYIRDCIINPDKTALVRDAIAAGASQYGMQTFDQSLYNLLQKDLIAYDEALGGATNPGEFKLRVEGIRSSGDISREDSESAGPDLSEVERFSSR
jgi:twitching motility protein PilT